MSVFGIEDGILSSGLPQFPKLLIINTTSSLGHLGYYVDRFTILKALYPPGQPARLEEEATHLRNLLSQSDGQPTYLLEPSFHRRR